MQILARFLDVLFPLSGMGARVRRLTHGDVLSLLKPSPIENGIALLPYKHPSVRALVTEAKFKGNPEAQQRLAHAVSDVLIDWLSDINGLDARPVILIPVPLSKKRYRERGYNQVLEVLKRVSLPPSIECMPHLLLRSKDTLPQTSLHKGERAKNLTGAFSARPLNPAYLYIVVDDVYTTGATLQDAVRALKEAGAVDIATLAFSYTQLC